MHAVRGDSGCRSVLDGRPVGFHLPASGEGKGLGTVLSVEVALLHIPPFKREATPMTVGSRALGFEGPARHCTPAATPRPVSDGGHPIDWPASRPFL